MDLKEKIKTLPSVCGVYIMKDVVAQTLYVGKASSLRRRVTSYFSPNVSIKTGLLVDHIADIEYIECSSEEQALILEAALIKERQPRYNVLLRDDKSYPYVEMTSELFPRIFVSRPRRKTVGTFFGPYPDVTKVRAVLVMIRKIFPYRSCRVMPKTACLFYHLRLCCAPCIGKVNITDYAAITGGVARVLAGERRELTGELEKKMIEFSSQQRFEEAKFVHEQLLALAALYQGHVLTHELIALKEALGLSVVPLVIEAFDISCLSGSHATGSLVVFRDGVPDKNSYRRYRIKEAKGVDDYAMMREVVSRRYRRLVAEKKPLPDLIIIDGGKSHVEAVAGVLVAGARTIPLIGIAKRNEEIWFPQAKAPLLIPRRDASLKLIQRLRDEAHRFARKYHLLLRRKRFIK
ncbi:MAG: excinuclease ABC subunit UvrC [Candidatus Omnitrophota bacterium]